jgi:hypothetical protein
MTPGAPPLGAAAWPGGTVETPGAPEPFNGGAAGLVVEPLFTLLLLTSLGLLGTVAPEGSLNPGAGCGAPPG